MDKSIDNNRGLAMAREHIMFRTKKKVAEKCVAILRRHCTWQDFFLEPAAGDGVFLDAIPTRNKAGMDTHPGRPGILKYSYIKKVWETKRRNGQHARKRKYLKIDAVVFGCPPFGSRDDKRWSTCEDFIRAAFYHAKIIAFILPKSYMKYSKQRIFPSNWVLADYEELPENSFVQPDGREYRSSVVFQVWINTDRQQFIGEDLREKYILSDDLTDMSRRFSEGRKWFMFGARPSRIILAEDVVPNNRGYFFNASDEAIEILKKIPWREYAYGRRRERKCGKRIAWYDMQLIHKLYIRYKETFK